MKILILIFICRWKIQKKSNIFSFYFLELNSKKINFCEHLKVAQKNLATTSTNTQRGGSSSKTKNWVELRVFMCAGIDGV